jgi:acyl-CoA reductase-like NAD-dependent aldehyde dehydrogenase
MSTHPTPEHPSGDLDPLEEPGRWEGLVAQIGARAAPHLAERRTPPGVLEVVVRWARPALATAASLLLLAAGGVLWKAEPEPETPRPAMQLAGTLLPTTFAGWITGTAEPSVAELVRDLERLSEVDR